MKQYDKWKYMLVGFLLSSIFCTGAVFAASKIDVNFLPLTFYFDGQQKKPSGDQQGMIFNGTTYVPLRFMADSMGKSVTYIPETRSVYVGKAPKGTVTYLTALKASTFVKSKGNSGDMVKPITSFTAVSGKKYTNGYEIVKGFKMDRGNFSAEYMLSKGYTKFQAELAPSSYWADKPVDPDVGRFKIFGDGREIYDSGTIPSDLEKPIVIDLDVSEYNKLTIEGFAKDQVAILDPRLIQ